MAHKTIAHNKPLNIIIKILHVIVMICPTRNFTSGYYACKVIFLWIGGAGHFSAMTILHYHDDAQLPYIWNHTELEVF